MGTWAKEEDTEHCAKWGNHTASPTSTVSHLRQFLRVAFSEMAQEIILSILCNLWFQ